MYRYTEVISTDNPKGLIKHLKHKGLRPKMDLQATEGGVFIDVNLMNFMFTRNMDTLEAGMEADLQEATVKYGNKGAVLLKRFATLESELIIDPTKEAALNAELELVKAHIQKLKERRRSIEAQLSEIDSVDVHQQVFG